ncbi:MAG: thioesterase [Gammaproteobacteria bacterium]|nr:thioesterase [Gammaproteobacteria bacterium]
MAADRPSFPSVAEVLELPSLSIRTVPAEWQDLNGHVNVRHYVEFYDEASRPLLPVLGLEGLDGDGGLGLFDLEHHIAYRAELHVGDQISAHLRIVARSAKRFHGVMFIVNHTRRQLASTLEFVSTAADLALRGTVSLPPAATRWLDAAIAAQARLTWPAPLCGSMAP